MAPTLALAQLPEQRIAAEWTAVYRLYDSSHQLLYVGMTSDIDIRFARHRRSGRFPTWVRHDIAWYPSRREARAAELQAIKELSPAVNVADHPRAKQRRSLIGFHEVAADLRSKIRRGVYPAGSKLPTREQLCELYGVSTQTIDSAKIVLRTEGLIVDRRRAGTFVVDPLPPSLPG